MMFQEKVQLYLAIIFSLPEFVIGVFPFLKATPLCDVAVLRLEVSALLDWSLFVVFLFMNCGWWYWSH